MTQALFGRGTTESALATDIAAMFAGAEHVVLAGALPRGQRVEVLLLGARGLYALYPCDWAGEIRLSPNASWRVRLPSGEVRSHENPRRHIRALEDALRAFLRDEFPSLRLPIHALVVFTSPQAQPLDASDLGLLATRLDDLPAAVAALERGQPEVADLPQLRALAQSLGDGHLTLRQRAWQPYTCSPSGAFGPANFWTIEQVLRHLERNPADGARHLFDGSLERWFREQGAPRLADLVRQATRDAALDARASLAEFLVAAGYLRRPHLSLRPRRLDLRYIVAGERATAWLRVRQGRGRGHLHGLVTPEAPYLTVEPDTFSGDADLRVTIETASLRADGQPCQASLDLLSNAWPEPISVPVTFRLRPEPPLWVRRVVLPLLGALLGGLLGLLLGLLVERWGLPLAFPWLVALGCYGALVGLWRGWRQNAAWPLGLAALRWLGRLLLRGALWVGAALALWGLASWAYRPLLQTLSSAFIVTVLALLAAASMIPATLEQLRAEGMIAASPGPRPLAAPGPADLHHGQAPGQEGRWPVRLRQEGDL